MPQGLAGVSSAVAIPVAAGLAQPSFQLAQGALSLRRRQGGITPAPVEPGSLSQRPRQGGSEAGEPFAPAGQALPRQGLPAVAGGAPAQGLP